MSMTTPYCEKHEWPGGMEKPCPDCAELAELMGLLHDANEAAAKAEDERDVLLLQVCEYRKMLERLEDFGLNAGNWTGNLEASAWNMTPVEDETLDHLWDEVRTLLSKFTEKQRT